MKNFGVRKLIWSRFILSVVLCLLAHVDQVSAAFPTFTSSTGAASQGTSDGSASNPTLTNFMNTLNDDTNPNDSTYNTAYLQAFSKAALAQYKAQPSNPLAIAIGLADGLIDGIAAADAGDSSAPNIGPSYQATFQSTYPQGFPSYISSYGTGTSNGYNGAINALIPMAAAAGTTDGTNDGQAAGTAATGTTAITVITTGPASATKPPAKMPSTYTGTQPSAYVTSYNVAYIIAYNLVVAANKGANDATTPTKQMTAITAAPQTLKMPTTTPAYTSAQTSAFQTAYVNAFNAVASKNASNATAATNATNAGKQGTTDGTKAGTGTTPIAAFPKAATVPLPYNTTTLAPIYQAAYVIAYNVVVAGNMGTADATTSGQTTPTSAAKAPQPPTTSPAYTSAQTTAFQAAYVNAFNGVASTNATKATAATNAANASTQGTTDGKNAGTGTTPIAAFPKTVTVPSPYNTTTLAPIYQAAYVIAYNLVVAGNMGTADATKSGQTTPTSAAKAPQPPVTSPVYTMAQTTAFQAAYVNAFNAVASTNATNANKAASAASAAAAAAAAAATTTANNNAAAGSQGGIDGKADGPGAAGTTTTQIPTGSTPFTPSKPPAKMSSTYTNAQQSAYLGTYNPAYITAYNGVASTNATNANKAASAASAAAAAAAAATTASNNTAAGNQGGIDGKADGPGAAGTTATTPIAVGSTPFTITNPPAKMSSTYTSAQKTAYLGTYNPNYITTYNGVASTNATNAASTASAAAAAAAAAMTASNNTAAGNQGGIDGKADGPGAAGTTATTPIAVGSTPFTITNPPAKMSSTYTSAQKTAYLGTYNPNYITTYNGVASTNATNAASTASAAAAAAAAAMTASNNTAAGNQGGIDGKADGPGAAGTTATTPIAVGSTPFTITNPPAKMSSTYTNAQQTAYLATYNPAYITAYNSVAATNASNAAAAATKLPTVQLNIPSGFNEDGAGAANVAVGSVNGQPRAFMVNNNFGLNFYNAGSTSAQPWTPVTVTCTDGTTKGGILSVSIASDGTICAIANDWHIYRYNVAKKVWSALQATNASGILFEKIIVGSANNMWAIEALASDLYQLVNTTNATTKMPTATWVKRSASCTDIGVGADGTILTINANNQVYRLVPATKTAQASWIAETIDKTLTGVALRAPGNCLSLTAIAVADKNHMCGIGNGGTIWSFNAGTQKWQPLLGANNANTVGFEAAVIDSTGNMFVIDYKGDIYSNIATLLRQGFEGQAQAAVTTAATGQTTSTTPTSSTPATAIPLAQAGSKAALLRQGSEGQAVLPTARAAAQQANKTGIISHSNARDAQQQVLYMKHKLQQKAYKAGALAAKTGPKPVAQQQATGAVSVQQKMAKKP